MIKFFILLIFTIQLQAQQMSNSPRSLDISGNLIIYLSNPSSSPLSMVLSMSNPNFSIEVNRCPLILSPKKICYIIITTKSQLLTTGLNTSQILNNDVEVGIVTRTHLSSSTSSISIQNSTLDFGLITNLGKTSSKSIIVTNTGSITITPIISVSGLEIVMNRCLIPILPNKSCSISVLFNAKNSLSNGVQNGLLFSAQASLSSSVISIPAQANLSIAPILLGVQYGSAFNTTLSSLGLGFFHTCAIASDNLPYCWGANDKGQLGNNSTIASMNAVAVEANGVLNGKTVKSISMGYFNSCIIASDNKSYCWGDNGSGQLGNNSTIDSLVPVAVDTSGVLNGKTIKSISAGRGHSCAIASDDRAYCWGDNGSGQLGNNSNYFSKIPVAVDTSGVLNGKNIRSISAGLYHTCAVANDYKVYCWGSNSEGKLGDGSVNDSLVPIASNMSGELNNKLIQSISLGENNSCVIANDDKLYCWGYNGSGQLGNNSLLTSLNPTAVYMNGSLNGKIIKQVSMGKNNVCVVASDSKAYCWGDNGSGQLGNNSIMSSAIPQIIDFSGSLNGKNVKLVSVGDSHVCVIASDNQAYCWGNNSFGQLGNNSLISVLNPQPINMSGALMGKTLLNN